MRCIKANGADVTQGVYKAQLNSKWLSFLTKKKEKKKTDWLGYPLKSNDHRASCLLLGTILGLLSFETHTAKLNWKGTAQTNCSLTSPDGKRSPVCVRNSSNSICQPLIVMISTRNLDADTIFQWTHELTGIVVDVFAVDSGEIVSPFCSVGCAVPMPQQKTTLSQTVVCACLPVRKFAYFRSGKDYFTFPIILFITELTVNKYLYRHQRKSIFVRNCIS